MGGDEEQQEEHSHHESWPRTLETPGRTLWLALLLAMASKQGDWVAMNDGFFFQYQRVFLRGQRTIEIKACAQDFHFPVTSQAAGVQKLSLPALILPV